LVIVRFIADLGYHQEIERILDRATPKTNRVWGDKEFERNNARETLSDYAKKTCTSRGLTQILNDDGLAVMLLHDSGSLFWGEFTLGLTGHAFIRSGGSGTKISFPASPDNQES